ncbi:MAG: enoyl-CoA hydratase/isomerase family protein [Alphaproteobacteria bacterium]|jgi:enoyl-CoA hydratase/carnithine racemase|nr:enoyl-CoA hydratase/isomerase family protein [Alphaproteobacteria bacterium]MDP6589332.1 enoyl-CoA hydratase/isomerase family protein [Alphaproteobacteria bacterium]
MPYETILYGVTDAAAHITLNRPKKLNAMNALCIREMRAALAEAHGDEAVRVVVLSGAGERAFTAGADITEMADKTPADMETYNRQWLGLFDDIESLPKPVIASVHGYATGGGTEMSLACDFVLCAEDSRFGLAEINIGVIPGAGAAVRLTRWMGRLKAKEILMLGEFVPGPEAVACGLANRCVPAAELAQVTAEWAAKLANKAPLALAAAKACVNEGAEAPMPAALEYELRQFLALFDSEDQKEGMTAFLEKRQAKFTGR